MWKKTIAAITTLAAMTAGAHARPSHHDEVSAAIGGLITGVVISELIEDANVSVEFATHNRDGWDRYDSDYRDYDYRGNRSYRGYDNDRRYRDSGHYIMEKRRIWVPGFWDYTCDRHGRSVKIWVAGHYEIRHVKVWVSDRDYHSRNYRENRNCR